MRKKCILLFIAFVSVFGLQAQSLDVNETLSTETVQAAIISCEGMIDEGLFESIKRRAELALEQGAEYLVLEISTYGGLVKSADDIAKHLILELSPKIRTVAYIKTEAISAGALISVSCQDIIMREHTTIGDCAPIVMGGKLEGVEREKSESFIRAAFDRAARANNYPQALLRAMVSMQLEVYQVKNLETGSDEYFEVKDLPKDANDYDLEGKTLVISENQILTVDAATAEEYGIARTVVPTVQDALAFLGERDGVTFSSPPLYFETNWSEEMVRMINHPAVIGVLTMVALLGLYMEFSTPGLGLPGLAAVIAFTIIIGSKYLVGMANWVEVAVFFLGIILLAIEVFVIPGFGIAGIVGIACVIGGLFGMLIRNPVDQFPWPQNEVEWNQLTNDLLGITLGFVAFVFVAAIISRFLPKTKLFAGLVLQPAGGGMTEVSAVVMRDDRDLRVGDFGQAVTPLRPTGRVSFGESLCDCVAQGEFLDRGTTVTIIKVTGNRILVQAADES